MEHSPLAKLPGELRHKIYELVFRKPKGIQLSTKSKNGRICYSYQCRYKNHPSSVEYTNREYPLALTETCNTIRQECVSLIYSSNMFYLADSRLEHAQTSPTDPLCMHALRACKEWLEAIGPEQAACIEYLLIETEAWNLRKDRLLSSNEWRAPFESVREMLYPTSIQLNSIRLRAYFDYHDFIGFVRPCRQDPTIESAVELDLPIENSITGCDEAEKAFKTVSMMLKSHKEHPICRIATALPRILSGLEGFRASVLEALSES